ncbi:hypothetical protein Goari_015044, partial [Gossypium aridum]|nr:hypothetical protein [Gossypium aridum]
TFYKFKDDEGNFDKSLASDVKGLLELYEAAHLRVHGEDILEDALGFTTTHLDLAKATGIIEFPLSVLVSRARDRPLCKCLPRLEARRFIDIYKDDGSHDKTLLKFAELDFNLLQNLHKEELSKISKWDADCIDQLSKYMKFFYKSLLDVYGEFKQLPEAYMVEAINWFHENYVPTMEEHMRNAILSAGYIMLTLASFIGMGDLVTPKIFNWASTNPKIIAASSIVARLMDDIASHKFEQERGHCASAVECYMREYGVSEQEACIELKKQVENARKDINYELMFSEISKVVPMPVLMLSLNLTRVIDFIYKDGEDQYTHVGKNSKDGIASLLINPIPLST